MAGADPLMLLVKEQLIAEAKGGKAGPPETVLEWARRYRRIDDKPFNLDKFRPLLEIYEDNWQRIVIMKPAQRGVSEYAINLVCFALEYGARSWVEDGSKAGLNVGYIFPRKQQLEDFSKERINSLREETPHLAMLFAAEEFDSLGFKQVGKSYLYLRGTYSETDLLSFTADVLVLDEFDKMDTSGISLARRRMNASEVKKEIAISTPTFPGRGISSAYLASDQRVYKTPCPACDTENTYDFFRDVRCNGMPYDVWKQWTQDTVDMSTVTLHCPNCAAEIDEAARCAPGRWEAQRPEMTRVHGYHVPWWPFPFIDLLSLAHSAVSDDPTELQELYRSDLGLPYGAGGAGVTEDMLIQLTTWQGAMDGGRLRLPDVWHSMTMGVDIGARKHYRITGIGPDGNLYVRAQGSVDLWADLDLLMIQYQIRQCIVDALPELEASQTFCNRWRGRAMRAFYPSNAKSLRGVLYHKRDLTQKPTGKAPPLDWDIIQINRTMAMDGLYAAIAGQRERWTFEQASEPETVLHLTSPTRVQVVDDNGQTSYSWIHTKPDHLFHAGVYDRVARLILPAAVEYEPAVGGDRPMAGAYQEAMQAIKQVPKIAPDPFARTSRGRGNY